MRRLIGLVVVLAVALVAARPGDAAAARQFTFQEHTLNANNPYELGPVDMPVNTDFVFALTSSEWDEPAKAGIEVTLEFERSTDNGATFQPSCAATVTVGNHGKNGSLPSFGCTFNGGANVKARGRVSVTAQVKVGAVITVTQ